MKDIKVAKKVVIDTSLFVNPDVRYGFGKTPTDAFRSFLNDIKALPHIEFYMPPSVFEELKNFLDLNNIASEDIIYLIQKSPKRHELMCPAYLLYELIEEMRDRVNKGLRIAEKSVRSVEHQKVDEIIQDLRRKYRDALREGIIDSKEDVDLLLLAMELDAFLITADKGLSKWADKLGIKWLFCQSFIDFMKAEKQTSNQ
ncbi:MAG: RNA ligase partner protein [Thermodesulfovibrionales bacterium]|nr:RNA ligase partner protein [Thermodesulfovibrionales bacterium]